jgi:hypothetical protein
LLEKIIIGRSDKTSAFSFEMSWEEVGFLKEKEASTSSPLALAVFFFAMFWN